MKKFIVLLTVSALVLALAPTTQASDLLIDSYSITVTSTSNTGDWASPLHILNPLGYATRTVDGSPAHAVGPFEFFGDAGAAPGLDGDLHGINHNSNGQTDTSYNNPDGTKMWLKFDLGQNYNLTQLRVWNGEYFREAWDGPFGINQVDLYYSSAEVDPGDDFNTGWTLIGTAGAQHFSMPTIASGGVSDGDFGVTDEIDLNSIDARWFAIKVNSTHGGAFCKLAEVQFLGIAEGEYYALPTPADSNDLELDPTTLSELSWVLPEGLSASATIQCWIDEYDENLVVGGNYDFTVTGTELTGIVSDLGAATASVDFVPTPLRKYIWKIEIVDPDNSDLDASAEFRFKTGTGNDDPLIDAGDASYTWLIDGERAYVLDGAVLNDAFDDVSSITWTRIDAVDPNAVIEPGTEELLGATVDIIAGGGNTYEFQLEVINFGVTYTDTVTLKVYDDGCTAMKNAEGYDVNAARARGDFNYNCEGDLDDLQELASKWLESSSL